jgi:DNA polymerase-3 subunit beta
VSDVEESTMGIGSLARASGLSVSALRFYDAEGVLVPAEVDPHTGYRRYTRTQVDDARLVAELRRTAMPLAGITAVLAHRTDPAVAEALLAEHLRRLTDGLVDARRALSRAHLLIRPLERVMTTIVLPVAELADAIDAVRHAVSADPELPALGAVLLELGPDGLRLVATDRFRLSVVDVTAPVDGPPASALLPLSALDGAHAHAQDREVTISVQGDVVTIDCASTRVLDLEFPDYRRLLHERPAGVAISAAALASNLSKVEADVATINLLDGVITVGPGEGLNVGVNPEFLLQALAAAGDGQLDLALDGPIAPLLVRSEDRRRSTLLMPIAP